MKWGDLIFDEEVDLKLGESWKPKPTSAPFRVNLLNRKNWETHESDAGSGK
jgi:hypothetical protein